MVDKIGNIEDITAYSHYLAMKGQSIGLTTIDGHKPTSEEIETKSRICRLCDDIMEFLPTCKPSEIADLTRCYTILYMMGHREMPNASLVGKQRDRLFRYWESGDKTIAENDVYEMLSDATLLDKLPTSQNSAFEALQEKWVNTLTQYKSFPAIDSYELYQRLALMMRDNIDSYFGGNSTATKEEWYKANEIPDITKVSSKILTAYCHFANNLFPAVMEYDEMRTHYVRIVKELITRNDLNEYDRKAYALELETA